MKSQNKRILWAAIVSMVLAAVILVTVVLPAEYNLDPLGAGEMLGVLGLSRPPPTAISAEEEIFKLDAVRFDEAAHLQALIRRLVLDALQRDGR